MYLRKDVDMVQFLKRISSCKGEVRFCTPQNDVLVLNSALSKYFFAYLVEKKEDIRESEIVCDNSEDEKLLGEFLSVHLQ